MPTLQEKTFFRLAAICTLAALLLVLLILADRFVPRRITPTAQLADKDSIHFFIDKANMNAVGVRIRGWAVHTGNPIETFDTQVLLRAADGTFYTIPSELVLRSDITTHFNDGNKYDASGFSVAGLSPALFAKGPFTIYLLYNNNNYPRSKSKTNILINTGKVL